MARKQNPDAPVAEATDTVKTAESTATPAPTKTDEKPVETVQAPEVTPEPEKAPEVPAEPEVTAPAPIVEATQPQTTVDPHERFKSITPEGITMYNFR